MLQQHFHEPLTVVAKKLGVNLQVGAMMCVSRITHDNNAGNFTSEERTKTCVEWVRASASMSKTMLAVRLLVLLMSGQRLSSLSGSPRKSAATCDYRACLFLITHA